MTKTIQIAENYQTLDGIIKTFNKTFLNYAMIPVFLTVFIFSLLFFLDFHSGDFDDHLLTFLHGFSSFLLMVISFAVSSAAIIMSISQYFTNKRHFVISYKNYYQNTFTDIEKSILENTLNDKFDNIIKENRKVIKKKLKAAKEAMENDILNPVFLESFKKDIEKNLKERKHYIPLLQSFAKDYHAKDDDTIAMERANQYLSKAGLSTFKTKKKPNFEIIEES